MPVMPTGAPAPPDPTRQALAQALRVNPQGIGPTPIYGPAVVPQAAPGIPAADVAPAGGMGMPGGDAPGGPVGGTTPGDNPNGSFKDVMSGVVGNALAAAVPGLGMVTGLGPVAGIAKDLGVPSLSQIAANLGLGGGSNGPGPAGPAGQGVAGESGSGPAPGSGLGGQMGLGGVAGEAYGVDPSVGGGMGPSGPSGPDPSAGGGAPGQDSDSGGYAHGGMVRRLHGPDPQGPDDGQAPLQRGEFVMKRGAVQQMGPQMMDAINRGLVSRETIARALRGR